jgi:hypothetical protein
MERCRLKMAHNGLWYGVVREFEEISYQFTYAAARILSCGKNFKSTPFLENTSIPSQQQNLQNMFLQDYETYNFYSSFKDS